ncbi:hypothetical protein DFH07DRAFT_859121 [Mycena maculata]|uniref:Uncharacterized protein n=1 Tax=Mycena maculata TaxID=230809 RepID=A0AAD7MIX8_9AGAR|nr:hypothetical protein DFH07DRAFT_859121 [Mycena maculata]
MGSRRKDTLIAEKDAEIQALRILLEAHRAQAVGANSRLAMALDTIDAVQALHASELSAEIRDKERLHDTLMRYLDIVKVAEIERDDLRDAVIQLAEKIESSTDDFTAWAHSRIKIPRLLGASRHSLTIQPRPP